MWGRNSVVYRRRRHWVGPEKHWLGILPVGVVGPRPRPGIVWWLNLVRRSRTVCVHCGRVWRLGNLGPRRVVNGGRHAVYWHPSRSVLLYFPTVLIVEKTLKARPCGAALSHYSVGTLNRVSTVTTTLPQGIVRKIPKRPKNWASHSLAGLDCGIPQTAIHLYQGPSAVFSYPGSRPPSP